MTSLKEAQWEAKKASEHEVALEVCELYADMTPLDKACAVKSISPAVFFRIKREHPDVQKAFYEAKEVQAELRLSEIDNLETAVLSGELDKDVFSTVIKSKQWSITKLRPDMFGTRTTVDVSGTIEHSPAKALAKLSEEQILRLANMTPAQAIPPAVPTQPETVDADYEEIEDETNKVLDTTITVDYNTPCEAPGPADLATNTEGDSVLSKSSPSVFDINSFGGWR